MTRIRKALFTITPPLLGLIFCTLPFVKPFLGTQNTDAWGTPLFGLYVATFIYYIWITIAYYRFWESILYLPLTYLVIASGILLILRWLHIWNAGVDLWMTLVVGGAFFAGVGAFWGTMCVYLMSRNGPQPLTSVGWHYYPSNRIASAFYFLAFAFAIIGDQFVRGRLRHYIWLVVVFFFVVATVVNFLHRKKK